MELILKRCLLIISNNNNKISFSALNSALIEEDAQFNPTKLRNAITKSSLFLVN